MAKTIRFNGRQLTAKEFIRIANANVRTASSVLHNVFGFDYNAYAHYGLINGTFTVNAIYDACNIPNNDKHNWCFAILIRQNGNPCEYYNRFHLVGVVGDDIDTESFKQVWRYTNNGVHTDSKDYFETFWRKGDFEEWRKQKGYPRSDNGTETLFILQRKEQLRRCKSINALDVETTRYRVVYSSSDNANCKPIDYNGFQFTEIAWRSKYIRYAGDENCSIRDCIDKSGYLIARKRNELARLASKRHAENKQNEFRASDFSSHVETLRARLEKARKEIANLLSCRSDAASVRKIGDLVGRWGGLSSAYSDFETFADHVKAKDYSSVERCLSKYNGILSEIAEIETAIANFDKDETAIA